MNPTKFSHRRPHWICKAFGMVMMAVVNWVSVIDSTERRGLVGNGLWISCEMYWESVSGSAENRGLAWVMGML